MSLGLRQTEGFELTHDGQSQSSVGLLDGDQVLKNNVQPGRSSKLLDYLRMFRLQIVEQLAFWRSSNEPRKVAIYRDRRVAAVHSLLHLVPFGGASVLLILFWTKYWVSETTDNALTLQFVAKLHELIMQASLVDVLLCIVRIQVVDGYIPLGALSGAAQATHLSYLWSLDFISALSSPSFTLRRKIMFAISMSSLLLMTALVGPSSAILMIPRPNLLHQYATTTTYLHGTESSMFPSLVNSSHKIEIKFDRWFKSELLSVTDNEVDTEYYSHIWNANEFEINPQRISHYSLHYVNKTSVFANRSTATIPTRMSADLLWDATSFNGSGSMWNLSRPLNPNITLQTYQPLVQVECEVYPLDMNENEYVYYMSDDGTRKALSSYRDLYARIFNDTDLNYIDNDNNGAYHSRPIWLRSPDPGSLALVGAFFSIGYPEKPFRVCTISSYWRKTETTLAPSDRGVLVQTNHIEGKDIMSREQLIPITIDLSNVTSANVGNLTRELANLTLYEPHDEIFVVAKRYENLLSVAFAAALAEIPHYSRRWDKKDDIQVDKASTTAFDISVMIRGYGYGTAAISVCLSVAVITAYCIVTLIYIAYILTTGTSSTAWNSGIELLTLALQSRRPDHLRHTSAGIDSMQTFRESVGIRVNEQDELELVFAHDRDIDTRRLTTIERNKAY